MDMAKKLLTLLAIFCVIASAGVVCAEDTDYQGGWAGSNYDDGMGDVDEGQYDDAPLIDPDYGHYEGAAGGDVEENDTNDTFEPAGTLPATTDMPGNITFNDTANTTDDAVLNQTGNAIGNATAPQTMLATGNPVLALLAVGAVLGGVVVLRRK